MIGFARQWYGVARDVPFCRGNAWQCGDGCCKGMAMKREEKDSKVGRGFGKVMKCAATAMFGMLGRALQG